MSNVKEVRFVTVSRPTRTEPGTQRVQMYYSATKDSPARLVDIGVIIRDRGIQHYKASFLDGTALVPMENFFATRSQAGHGIARAFEKAVTAALEAAMMTLDTASTMASPEPAADESGLKNGMHDTPDEGEPGGSSYVTTLNCGGPSTATTTETVPEPTTTILSEEEIPSFPSRAAAASALGISKSAVRKRIQRGKIVIEG